LIFKESSATNSYMSIKQVTKCISTCFNPRRGLPLEELLSLTSGVWLIR